MRFRSGFCSLFDFPWERRQVGWLADRPLAARLSLVVLYWCTGARALLMVSKTKQKKSPLSPFFHQNQHQPAGKGGRGEREKQRQEERGNTRASPLQPTINQPTLTPQLAACSYPPLLGPTPNVERRLDLSLCTLSAPTKHPRVCSVILLFSWWSST
jgi:hypothetical protein